MKNKLRLIIIFSYNNNNKNLLIIVYLPESINTLGIQYHFLNLTFRYYYQSFPSYLHILILPAQDINKSFPNLSI